MPSNSMGVKFPGKPQRCHEACGAQYVHRALVPKNVVADSDPAVVLEGAGDGSNTAEELCKMELGGRGPGHAIGEAVSYTHLTLPTICSV
eukprot:3688676-Alexandrium_andersonii.AAC.2